MLECDRIDISEGIDVNKTNLSNKFDICYYWDFKDIGFKHKPYLCNGCPNLMQKAMSFNNIDIVYVKGNSYRIHFWYMSKDDATNIMNGSNSVDKRSFLYIFFIINFLLYIKMRENTDLTYYQKNRDAVLNKAKNYYKNNKER